MKYSIISNFISLESFFEIITIIFFIDNYLIISIFKIIKVFRCFRILKIMNVFQELYIENVDNKFKVHFFQLIILFSTLSIISGGSSLGLIGLSNNSFNVEKLPFFDGLYIFLSLFQI